jgi:transcriptional regulator with XRE-family HTH domain
MDRKGLAEAASISYSYLSAIESGQKIPSPKLEEAIAAALGVPASEILALANGAYTDFEEDHSRSPFQGNASDRASQGDRGSASDRRTMDHGLAPPDETSSRTLQQSAGRYLLSAAAMPGMASPEAPESERSSGGLSSSGALAELRVLLQQMSPEDAAMVVSMARRLSGQSTPSYQRSRTSRESGSYRGRQGRELRTSAYLRFWTDYMTKVRNRGLDWVEGRHPEPRSYFTMASPIKGASISASFARNRLLRHELYINRGSRDANMELLRELDASKRTMEAAYGRPLEFEDPGRERRAVRIAEYREGHISRSEEYGDYIEWFIDCGLRLRRAVDAFLTDRAAP